MSSFYPIPNNENERLRSLNSYALLDTASEEDFDELTALASEIAQTPIALVTLLDNNRQWFKSTFGTNLTETHREHAFCSHSIVNPADVMVVNDARTDERFMKNPLVTGDTNIVFYAGVPLVNSEGYALGTLCVIDHEPKELTDRQVTALRTLARQVLTQMELRRKVATLQEANNQLQEANTFIDKFAKTAAHDIKNPMSSILLTSQALEARLKGREDDKSSSLASLIGKSAKRLIGMLNEMLVYSKDPSLLLKNQQGVHINSLLQGIIETSNVPDNISIELPHTNPTIFTSAIALQQIFTNLISNAIRYNDKEQGVIKVEFNENRDYYRFSVTDNGIGIADEHFTSIFNKQVTLNKVDRFNMPGFGLGLHTVKMLIDKLQGSIKVISEVGKGSSFIFTIAKTAAYNAA